MADKYQTSDGRIFDHQFEAQDHANRLASDNESHHAAQRINDSVRANDYNKLVRAYNAGDWNEILKSAYDVDYHFDQHSYNIKLIKSIARANIKGDYEFAFEAIWWDKNQSTGSLGWVALEAGKKAWEKKNGRTLTESELNEVFISLIEKKIAEAVSRGSISKCSGNVLDAWNKLTGKNWEKMTKADQIRIYGKPFPKGSGSSRSRSTSTTGGSILFNIIGAIVVAIIGFGILGWIGLIGGAVGGFFFGKWLSGKIIGKILLIVLLVLVGGTFIINKLPPKPATENTQTVNEE